MSPQHLQLVINRLDYTLNKNTFKVEISFHFFKKKSKFSKVKGSK